MLKLLLLTLILVNFCGLSARAAQQQDCSPPKITPNTRPNIFSPEQEMILGELTYQRALGEWRVIKEPQLTAYVTGIGDRLIKHLPPTGLKFQFFIIDIPEANAFNLPGGYIYVSRKLVALANNEDELAGVIAHELGHGSARHVAADFSQLFKKILNVTQVGDRKDLTEKYNLFLERESTKHVSQSMSRELKDEIEADRIGLFAFAAAGYDPAAFAKFTERLEDIKGKSGNWFTDLFANLEPNQKVLREEIKATQRLPMQCREGRRASASQEFLKWQADVVSYRDSNRRDDLPGLLWKKDLTPRLRSDISHYSFSPDGKYFLAQDDFAITVIQRAPAKVLFQIPASEAEHAFFTPDAQFVVFGTQNLRHEKWSVAEQKPVEIRELSVSKGCFEHKFSDDGQYLACIDDALGFIVLETQTGKKIWEQKDFYRLGYYEYLSWAWGRTWTDDAARAMKLFHLEFSTDNKFLLAARSNKSRVRYSVNQFMTDESEDTLLALDLSTLKPVRVGGDLKKITVRPFIFLDPKRILGMGSKVDESGIFSFPDGKRLAKFAFGAEELERTANPNYVIIKPLSDARMGIFDLPRAAIVSASDKADASIWENSLVYESLSGEVLLSQIRYDEEKKNLQIANPETIEIPVAAIGQLYAVDVSDNFQWLALSSKTRGAIWSLNSGDRKMFLAGFRGALLANDGAGIGDFPKQGNLNHALALLNPHTNQVRGLREIPEGGAKQYGGFVLMRQSLKEPKKQSEEKIGIKQNSKEAESERSLRGEVRFELRSVINDKLVWSREFPKQAPGFFFDSFSGRLILYWSLGSEAGKARIKEDLALSMGVKALGNMDDDYVLEVVDAFAGKTIGTLLIETGNGSFDIKSAISEGDWVLMDDSNNRVLVYSIKEGTLRHRFFGANAAINGKKNMIVVQNYPGELTAYDLDTGDSAARLTFARSAAFVRFSLDGKKLFVLGEDQTAYAFDADKLLSREAAHVQ